MHQFEPKSNTCIGWRFGFILFLCVQFKIIFTAFLVIYDCFVFEGGLKKPTALTPKATVQNNTKAVEETTPVSDYMVDNSAALEAIFRGDAYCKNDTPVGEFITSDPKYALHKKHKMIAALKKHGKGEVILTTLSCLDGCLGCNPVLDKLIVNFVEKE